MPGRRKYGATGNSQHPVLYSRMPMEFENYSECYENLTLAQAVDIYKKIRKRNACSIPGIGFELQDPGNPGLFRDTLGRF